MGEARRAALRDQGLVWHHTSTLRTHQMWMSGRILREGETPDVRHPELGLIRSNAALRRAMEDFPPLVWFTRSIEVPRCLISTMLIIAKPDGSLIEHQLTAKESAGLTLRRLALGFEPSEIDVVPWPEYRGYSTEEGRRLNASAREFGDDPDEWFVSEAAADIEHCHSIRVAKSLTDLKMVRSDRYLEDVKKMVRMCRETPGAFIPPTWMSRSAIEQGARQMNVPVRSPR